MSEKTFDGLAIGGPCDGLHISHFSSKYRVALNTRPQMDVGEIPPDGFKPVTVQEFEYRHKPIEVFSNGAMFSFWLSANKEERMIALTKLSRVYERAVK